MVVGAVERSELGPVKYCGTAVHKVVQDGETSGHNTQETVDRTTKAVADLGILIEACLALLHVELRYDH